MPDDLDPDDTGTDDLDPEDTGTEPVTEPPKPAPPKVPKQASAPKIEGEFDQARAERTIQRVRDEALAERARAQKAEQDRADLLKSLQKALGQDVDDKPDPEKLRSQIAAAEEDARQRRVDLQVLRLAPNLEADADMLLDSSAFAKSIKDLDPAASGFREDLTDAITEFLSKHPRYKSQTAPVKVEPKDDDPEDRKPPKPPAGRSGADLNGQGTKPRQVTQAELAKMTPQQIVDARGKGLLDTILNG